MRDRSRGRFAIPVFHLVGVIVWLGAALPSDGHLAIIRQGPECGGLMEAGDQYGWALAVGDFNNDGYEDLAVGTPYEDVATVTGTAVNAGAVFINYGCPTGLTSTGHRVLTQDYLGSSSEAADLFGYALAAGDFDHDGYDDLAVGSPGEDLTVGVVFIIYGSSDGLTAARWVLRGQGGSVGANETGDNFGWSLAAGNFNNDAYEDLAVGIPGEDLELAEGTIFNAGAVNVYYGAAEGLSLTGAMHLRDADTGGDAQDNAQFGYSLAAGDFNGSGHADLAVGVPFKEAGGGPQNHGVVEVLFGSAGGLSAAGYLELDSSDFGDAPSAFDRFGFSLARGQANNDAYADLAIGVPFRSNAGAVYLIYGSSAGPDLGNTDSLARFSTGGDFGYSVAFGDWDGDGYDDLAAGSPGLNSDGGSTFVYRSSATGSGITSSSFSETQEKLNEVTEPNDRMGFAVAFGSFAGGARKGLAIGATGEDYEPFPGSLGTPAGAAGQVLIDMPWLQVQNMTCRAAMLTGCNDEIVFSFKAFEPHLLASTTKIMTALLACEATQPGCNPCANLSDVYTVPTALCDPASVPGGLVGGSTANLCPSEQITFQNLLYSCMYPSGNDAAFSIADHLFNPGQSCVDNTCQDIFDFAALMNQRAAELGMTTAFFQHPSGAAHGATWPSRNVASANDMARLAYYAMQNPLFYSVVSTTNWPMTRVNYACGSSNVTWCNNAAPVPGCSTPDFPNGTGVKGGSTPAAGFTFVGSVDHPEGRFFGVTFGHATNPVRRSEFQAMLTLGANVFCTGPFVPQPPPPGTVLKAPEVPSGPGAASSFKFPIDEEPDKPFNARVTLSEGTTSAHFEMKLSRGIQVGLQPGETATSTVAPFETHDGIIVTNIGDDPVDLQIDFDQPAQQLFVTLASGQSAQIPPYAASALQAQATLAITNSSSTGASYLDISENGYAFERTLAAGSGAFSVRMTASHLMGEDQVDVEIYGLDTNPNAAVDLLLAQTHDADPGCDGTLDFDDLPAFILALVDPDAYESIHEGCYIGSADRNGDGLINGLDIRTFVSELVGP